MITRNISKPFMILLLGMMCAFPLADAWAQQPGPQPGIQMRKDFSDDELKSFVKTNEKVTVIQM